MRIAVNDRLTLDILMEIGDISEKMVVQAQGQLLETTSSSVATLIDHRRLTEMPLIYGNPMMLQFLAAGTTWNAPLHYQAPWDGSGASMSSVNGSKTRSIDFQVDGISNNTKGNDIAYTPSVEFIEEYKVETTAYDASQGHGAAWVNASMKSGTNELHGSAYMYIQHKDLNANGFFSNLAGQPKGDFNYDRWQASAGGPLIKNKTFWFTGIERIKTGSASRRIFTVPTAAEKKRRPVRIAGDRQPVPDLRPVDDYEPEQRALQPAALRRQHHPRQPDFADRQERPEVLSGAERRSLSHAGGLE